MTSDELRKLADTSIQAGFSGHAKIFRAAADAIDRLTTENAEWKKLTQDAIKKKAEVMEKCGGIIAERDALRQRVAELEGLLDTVAVGVEFLTRNGTFAGAIRRNDYDKILRALGRT